MSLRFNSILDGSEYNKLHIDRFNYLQVHYTGSFTGSFNGDGSGLTGIASTLALTGSSGTGTVALKTQTLSILPGSGLTTVASGQGITVSGEDASSANKGIASFSDSRLYSFIRCS